MNNIVKRGLGKIQSLVTRGYGKFLVVLVGGAEVKPAKFWDTYYKYIKTKKIRVPDEEDEIVCDVILLNPLDLGIMNDIVLLSKKYNAIKVYNINEVTIK